MAAAGVSGWGRFHPGNILANPTLRNVLRNWALWFGLGLLILIFGLLEPRFWSSDNFWNVLRQAAPLGLIVAGQTIVLIGGRFDLSVGSTTALTSVVMVTAVWEFGTVAGSLLGILAGVGVGVVNGVIIGRWNLNALIVTIGMMTAIRGLVFWISGGGSLHGDIPRNMLVIGNDFVGPVPVPVIVAAVGFILLHFFLRQTALGRRVYAVGGNREAARLAGINLFHTTFWTFVLSGLFAGVAGVILTSRLGVGTPTIGEFYPLESIAAAVIGGVAIMGGRGNALGAILGVLLLSVIRNGLNLYGVPSYAQEMATGLIIIFAIFIDRFKYGRGPVSE